MIFSRACSGFAKYQLWRDNQVTSVSSRQSYPRLFTFTPSPNHWVRDFLFTISSFSIRLPFTKSVTNIFSEPCLLSALPPWRPKFSYWVSVTCSLAFRTQVFFFVQMHNTKSYFIFVFLDLLSLYAPYFMTLFQDGSSQWKRAGNLLFQNAVRGLTKGTAPIKRTLFQGV